MFDLSWSHILVVLVVAIVVIGPKDLPRVLRTVGRWTGKVKRMARDFQDQFNEALREAELDTIQKDVEDLAKVDMSDVNTEMAKTSADIMTELNKTTAEPVAAPPAGERAEERPAPAPEETVAPVDSKELVPAAAGDAKP
jgi:sec-independent protein translocase protein TatB